VPGRHRVQLAVVFVPALPSLWASAELADGYQAADHEHQHGERRQEDGLGHVGGQLGARSGAADRDDAEGDTAGEQCVACAVRRHGADQRGDAHYHQRSGGGLQRALPECVDQHRDGEDRAAAAERSQAQADKGSGAQGEEKSHAASGPTRCSPAFAALSNSSSTATSCRPEASRIEAATEAR